MTDSILHWNQLSLDAVKTDCSATGPGLKPEQRDSIRTARALAIVQLAMHDAYVGIKGGPTCLNYAPGDNPGTTDTHAAQAAVSASACRALIAMYPRQREHFFDEHERFVAAIPDNDQKIVKGLAWGMRVAEKMLAAHEREGSFFAGDAV